MYRILIRCATFLVVFGIWFGRTRSANHIIIWSAALVLALAGLAPGYRRFTPDKTAWLWVAAAALDVLLCVVALRPV